jgi:pimeloyl-ACP methyl ester carboxylesterase
MMRLSAIVATLFLALYPALARAASTCEPDGVQTSGAIYRICMPAPADYNGILIVYAHGYQDAGTPVAIPENQLCVGALCIPDVANALGFGFATSSYRKTGLAVLEGQADLLDLVRIYTARIGNPRRVYLVGASEGGLIAALSLERHADVYSAGIAACGPIGDFPFQINYLVDARATFEYFFPGLIPGSPFDPDPGIVAIWGGYYDQFVKPVVLAAINRTRLAQWVKVAQLPFDPSNYLATVEVSLRDVLHYSVVNLNEATTTLGGFPFDNTSRWYAGSSNDLLMNLLVPRRAAASAAVTAMNTLYRTSGVLTRPLVTLHTLRDQQVPFAHEQVYALKTAVSGALLTRHAPLAVDRFGHCNFTPQEMIAALITMMFYDQVVP